MDKVSQDLVNRLRTVGGCAAVKAPALDQEAADHITKQAKRIQHLEALYEAYAQKSYQYDLEHPNDGLNAPGGTNKVRLAKRLIDEVKEEGVEAQPTHRDLIREIFLANGFTIKDGCDDLKPYVYAAAEALLKAAASKVSQ